MPTTTYEARCAGEYRNRCSAGAAAPDAFSVGRLNAATPLPALKTLAEAKTSQSPQRHRRRTKLPFANEDGRSYKLSDMYDVFHALHSRPHSPYSTMTFSAFLSRMILRMGSWNEARPCGCSTNAPQRRGKSSPTILQAPDRRSHRNAYVLLRGDL